MCSRTYRDTLQHLVTEVIQHILEIFLEWGKDRDRSQNTGAGFKRNICKLTWPQDRGMLDRAMPSGCGCIAQVDLYLPTFPGPRLLF